MIVALTGLVISLFAYLIAFPNPQRRRFDIYAALLALHLGATITYWLLSFESAMDAFTYYRDPFGFMQQSPFVSGTYFVTHMVQNIKTYLGGSFLDHFLLFQCFGMVGIALLARCLNEVADSLGVEVPLQVYAILFFPGIHFWSVAIGKDGLLIMAIGLSLWSVMRLERRFLWMALALLIMGVIRPHVAVIALVAIACALFFTKQLPLKYKVIMGPAALVAMVFLGFIALDKLGVQSLDLEALADFIDDQQSMGEKYGGGADLQSLPFPAKVFTLLFRPLYVDSPGMLGYVASLENTFLLFVFGYIAVNWRLLVQLSRNVPYMAYSVVFSSLLVVLLSMVNYNMGLGQRQKMMAIPAVLLIFGTLQIYKRYLAARPQTMAVDQDEGMPAVSPARA